MSVAFRPRTGAMLASTAPDGSPLVTRDFTPPTFVVSRSIFHDVALLFVEENGQVDAIDEQKIVQYRLDRSADCSPTDGGASGCTGVTRLTVDLSGHFTLRGQDLGPALADRRGVFQYQPAAFIGNQTELVSLTDSRVGLFWYVQPYRGRTDILDEFHHFTAVEGTISGDAGMSWGLLRRITIPSPTAPSVLHFGTGVGTVFVPCTPSTGDPRGEYYGEYNGGAFRSPLSDDLLALAAWGDSREGCESQDALLSVHHHVFAGGPW